MLRLLFLFVPCSTAFYPAPAPSDPDHQFVYSTHTEPQDIAFLRVSQRAEIEMLYFTLNSKAKMTSKK